MTVPGIGPIISSAMVAAIATGDVFSKGRDFGAWLREHLFELWASPYFSGICRARPAID